MTQQRSRIGRAAQPRGGAAWAIIACRKVTMTHMHAPPFGRPLFSHMVTGKHLWMSHTGWLSDAAGPAPKSAQFDSNAGI